MKVTLPKMTPVLGPDWAVADEDVVGELGWRALLQSDIGRTFASQAADGWGGDRYALLKNKAGAYSLAMTTQWDSAEEAREFAGLLSMALYNRDDFKEVTDDLLSGNPTRLWQGPRHWWVISTDGKRISIAIADNARDGPKDHGSARPMESSAYCPICFANP